MAVALLNRIVTTSTSDCDTISESGHRAKRVDENGKQEREYFESACCFAERETEATYRFITRFYMPSGIAGDEVERCSTAILFRTCTCN
jgi:hypothetical protein